ncbi:tetratricopeptide repeat protein [Nitrospirillum sp. BR 11828]|uniref:tetratricopeptide repeat protein n=1 Tax=Nitrospirillum sp. BR 11828 TaxID=3104325 RepID=UPI002ACA43C3|nr:tetratricopeptide repeat protein [Nitrospirillum sp. BR 11828]MDZ5648105.1 tetratricopeptide repeat protein [Nitrospirillum sp. BR 11828]
MIANVQRSHGMGMGEAMRGGVFAVLVSSGLVFSGASVWAQDQGAAPAQGQAAPAPADPQKAAEDAEDQAMVRVLREGMQAMRSGQPRQAIASYDQVIATYEARYKGRKEKVYCGSTTVEVLAYMVLAASQKQSAIAVAPNWAIAYFLKGYAQVELQDLPGAKASLEHARDLSPYNPQFLIELANLYKSEKNWPLALETYQAAKEHSAAFSLPQAKDTDEMKALHGIAFVYSETGKLEEAEAIYKQCLAKNPQDAYAQHELDYVVQQKANQAQVH